MTTITGRISDMQLYWLLKDEEWVQPSTLEILQDEEVDVHDR